LSILGTVFVLLTTLVIPLSAMQSAKRVRQPGAIPDRKSLLVSVLIQQVILIAFSLLAARAEHLALFPAAHFGLPQGGMAATFLAVFLGTLPMRWNWRTTDQKRRMLWRIPNQPSELGGWLLISLGAGISEELLYRGVMFQLWLRVLGSWWPAALICTVAFALAHSIAGWRSVGIIAVMALATHFIVQATGDLYTAMGIHFLYDLLAGAVFVYLAKRDGLVPAGRAPAASGGTP